MTEFELKAEASERQPRFWWHWQNLNDDREGRPKGNAFWHGRAWWHFMSHPNRYAKVIQLEWSIGKLRFGIGIDFDDEDMTIKFVIPLVALYLSFGQGWEWVSQISPRRTLSPPYQNTIVVDDRSCSVRIFDWRLWIQPWARSMESRSSDPWWIRGITIDLNPFEWTFNRHEVQRADGSWTLVPKWKLGEGTPPDEAAYQKFPYRYVRKSGNVQDRIATVKAERRAWRPRCLRWTSLIEKVRASIHVDFDDEVGEEYGSWKGGCMGCGYDILPGETVEQCLRRMERERRF